MALSSRGNSKLLRVRRIRGQVEAVERAIEDEIGYSDVLQLIAAARGALNGLLVELLDDTSGHMSSISPIPSRVELLDVIHSYLK